MSLQFNYSQDIKDKDTINPSDSLDKKPLLLGKITRNAKGYIKINKKEGKITWNDDSKKIIGKINGLHPNPGAYFIFNGDRYKILKAEIGNGSGHPGEVLNDKLEIACSNKIGRAHV